jgi:hypothetical protein
MLEFREAVLTSLLNLLRTSLEQQLSGQSSDGNMKLETRVVSSSPTFPDVSSMTVLRAKEEVMTTYRLAMFNITVFFII